MSAPLELRVETYGNDLGSAEAEAIRAAEAYFGDIPHHLVSSVGRSAMERVRANGLLGRGRVVRTEWVYRQTL